MRRRRGTCPFSTALEGALHPPAPSKMTVSSAPPPLLFALSALQPLCNRQHSYRTHFPTASNRWCSRRPPFSFPPSQAQPCPPLRTPPPPRGSVGYLATGSGATNTTDSPSAAG